MRRSSIVSTGIALMVLVLTACSSSTTALHTTTVTPHVQVAVAPAGSIPTDVHPAAFGNANYHATVQELFPSDLKEQAAQYSSYAASSQAAAAASSQAALIAAQQQAAQQSSSSYSYYNGYSSSSYSYGTTTYGSSSSQSYGSSFLGNLSSTPDTLGLTDFHPFGTFTDTGMSASSTSYAGVSYVPNPSSSSNNGSGLNFNCGQNGWLFPMLLGGSTPLSLCMIDVQSSAFGPFGF